MKIEQRGVVITEVPGFRSITVKADGGDARVVLAVYNLESPLEFVPATLAELIEALQEAHKHALQIAGIRPESENTTGPWDRLEDIPEHITRVWDNVDDLWERNGRYPETGWNYGRESARESAPFRLHL